MDEDSLSRLVAAKIQAAEQGDTRAAKWLLKEFCGAVKQSIGKNGKQLQGPSGPVCVVRHNVLVYLSECFEQILDGVQASKALSVGHERSGRPKLEKQEILNRYAMLCVEVLTLRGKMPKPTLRDAYRTVASKHRDVSVRAVETAWKNKTAKTSAELIRRLKQGK